MAIPTVSAKTMQDLRESAQPTKELIQEFCKAQPNMARALKDKLGEGDIGLSVVTDFAMCWKALVAEDAAKNKDPFLWS